MYLPESKVADAHMSSVLLGDGTRVGRGARVTRSVLGVRSLVGKYVVMDDTVMLGADYYESASDRAVQRLAIGVGDGCTIRKAIIDKNARIGMGSAILNKEGLKEGGDEKQGWMVVDGVVVVLKGATLMPGTII